MPTRLYPPQIAGTLPAFYKSYDSATGVLKESSITIPFTSSALVSSADFIGFYLRLKTSSTNTYLFPPIYSKNYDSKNSTVTFTLTADQSALLNEGQYYKVQIAYVSQYVESETTDIDNDRNIITNSVMKKLTGYYSTIGIIKCVQEPKVSIQGYSIDSINLFNNELFGVYELSSNLDQTEKVYSYNFSFYLEDGNLYYSTGELLHNNANDNEYGLSIDSVVLSSFIKTSEIYKLIYTVTTINGLVVSSPTYRVTAETLLAPSKNLNILPRADSETGSIKISFKGLEKTVKIENTIKELKRKEVYYNYSKSLISQIKQKINPDYEYQGEQITNLEYLLKISSNDGMTRFFVALQKLLRDNAGLISELCGVSPGLLMSLVDISADYTKVLSQYIISITKPTMVEKDFQKINDQFLKNTTNYILTTTGDYKNLNTILQVRLNSYVGYLFSSIATDETDFDEIVTDQNLINLAQSVITLAGLSEELAIEYMSILGYAASIVATEEKSEDTYFGQYILVRASEEDDYRSWLELKRFKLENIRPSTINYVDYTVKQGVKYIYGIIQYNLFGIYSARIESEPISVDFEDIFLYDGERVLKIKFNPKVSSFKSTILEQKTNTIGNKYPFIFRNGNVNYKEFPISGLISYQMDNELLFYNREIEEYIRNYTLDFKSLELKERIEKQKEFLNKMDQILINPCDLVEENIHKERDFKIEVLNWLNNGKPKLFKSGPEGNFIVRIMNVSLSPTDSLGRMLHSFTGQCAEIAEFNYNNLLRYGFIKADIVSKYVSLWKTYYLNEYKPGKDIELLFDSGINYFAVEDLKPGSSIFLTYGDTIDRTEDEIIIGITGAYRYENSSRIISKIRIPNSIYNHPVGILECQYQGLRYSDFDAITSVNLKTIVSNQYIGVDPILENIKVFATDPSDYAKQLFIKALKALNDRILLNDNLSYSDLRGKLVQRGFEPGDIVQHINSSFYNYEKDKVKILNLEQLKIRVRELIPIYAVPYDYITQEGWDKLPDSVVYWNSNGMTTSCYKDKKEKRFSRSDYENLFPSQNLLYSVTPFGKPYPIDALTPLVKDYFDINDEFCVFQMFEYSKEYQTWMPTCRNNVFNIATGQYYDCYWQSVLKEYDTSYYIGEKYRYEQIVDIQQDKETQRYYIIIQNKKYYLSDEFNLYVEINGEYKLLKEVYLFPTDEDGYYTIITNNDSRIQDNSYLNEAVRWKNKDDYNPVPGYNLTTRTIDENNIAKSIVKASEIKPFYLRIDNAIQLNQGDTQYYTNLGSPKVIKIGTGLIAEATFQLEVLDYFTEKNDDSTFLAKNRYLERSEILKNFYRNYEILGDADNNFQRFLTLSRFYNTLLKGLTDSNNTPYEDKNTYQSNLNSPLNYQDRTIVNEILNTDKEIDLKNTEIADLWTVDNSSAEKKNKIKNDIKTTINKMQINKRMKEELVLQDTEENDLFDLIKNPTKEGINDKLAKLNELYELLSSNKNTTIINNQNIASDYAQKLKNIDFAVNSYNNAIYNYKAHLWLYCLIYQKIAKLIYIDTDNYDEKLLTEDVLDKMEANISISNILAEIKNHYNKIIENKSENASNEAELIKQKNYYLNAYGSIQKNYSEIFTYKSIINEKEGDTALDELLIKQLMNCLLDIFYQYSVMKQARKNINELLNGKVQDEDTDIFKKYIGINEDADLALSKVKQKINTLKIEVINNKDNLTLEDLFSQYNFSKDNVSYFNSLNQKLTYSKNNVLGFLDSHATQVKEYVQKIDYMEYIYKGGKALEWQHYNYSYFIGFDRLPYQLWDLNSKNEDIKNYTYEIEFRSRILKSFSYWKDNNFGGEAPAYISTMSSNQQNEIRSQVNRKIILDISEDNINTDDLDIYTSFEFDGQMDSAEQKAIQKIKIQKLLSIIETFKEATDYRSVLDNLSDLISYMNKNTNGLGETCFKTLYGVSGDKDLITILTNYNQTINSIQDELIKSNELDTQFIKIGQISKTDFDFFNPSKVYYILKDDNYQLQTAYSNTAIYYLKLKDYLVKTHFEYYNALMVTKDYQNITTELIYSVLNSQNTKKAEFELGKMQLYNLNGFVPTVITKENYQECNNFIYNNVTKFERQTFDSAISYDKKSKDTFLAKNITGGDNALSSHNNSINAILTNYNNLIKKNGIVNKLYSTYSKLGNTPIVFTNEGNNALNALDLSKINISILTASDTTAVGKFKHLLLIKYLSKFINLFYWCNTQLFVEYDLDIRLAELYTNLPKPWSEASENYPSITAHGIVYWYLEYVLNKAINDYNDALEQAELLNIFYTNKQTNYKEKQALYEAKYKEYLQIFTAFMTPEYKEYWKYYNSSDIFNKNEQMKKLIEEVKNLWYDFILTLDKGFKKEIEAGMYQ